MLVARARVDPRVTRSPRGSSLHRRVRSRAAVFRHTVTSDAARAAAGVTAARWGRCFGEARRLACKLFGRGEAASWPCIHLRRRIVICQSRAPHFQCAARGRLRGGGVAWDASGSTALRPAKIFALAQRRRRDNCSNASPTPSTHKRGVTCAADASRRVSQQIVSPRPPFFWPPDTPPPRPSSSRRHYSSRPAP